MRPLLMLLLASLALTACTSNEAEGPSRASAALAALNAENDVRLLLSRYSDAQQRYEEYWPIVTEETNRLKDLRARLAQLRIDVAVVQKAVGEQDVALATATKARDAKIAEAEAAKKAQAAADAAHKVAAAENEKLVTATKEFTEAKKALEDQLADGASEKAVMELEINRLSMELKALRARVLDMKTGGESVARRLAEIEAEINAVIEGSGGAPK